MRFSVWVLLSFFFFILLSFSVTTKTLAQTLPAAQPKADRPLVENSSATGSYTAPQTNPDVPKNLHTWTQNVMIETISALICQLAGVDPVNPNGQCLGVDQKTGKIGFVQNGGGLVGVMGDMITMLYTPPIHMADYFQNLADNFGLVKPAHAQLKGAGFIGITPILGLWTSFRNIVYLLFVLVFVIIGIAIMLRVKIDPRTVMTIQNQIPKIIVGLLLVTFSFAIAGFLIDVMYTSIFLAGNTLISADSHITSDVVNQVANSTQPFAAANYISRDGGILGIVKNSSGGVRDVITNLLKGALGRGGGFLGPIIGFIVGLLGLIIILVAIIFALFRLWFALISAYIFLLLDVVFAPFWIFAGLIPGSPVTFGLWLRDIVSNLAAFPVAIVMFLLARVFMDAFPGTGTGAGVFTPPLVGNLNSTAFPFIIALGFILLTPNAVNMTKAALKAPKFDTTPIKQAVGAGAAVPGRISGGGTSLVVGTEYRAGPAGERLGGVLRAFGLGRR